MHIVLVYSAQVWELLRLMPPHQYNRGECSITCGIQSIEKYLKNSLENTLFYIELLTMRSVAQLCVSVYLYSLVEKCSVHSFSDGLHPSEGEGQVGQTSTHPGSW